MLTTTERYLEKIEKARLEDPRAIMERHGFHPMEVMAVCNRIAESRPRDTRPAVAIAMGFVAALELTDDH